MAWLKRSLIVFCFLGATLAGIYVWNVRSLEASLRAAWPGDAPFPKIDLLRLDAEGLHLRLAAYDNSWLNTGEINMRIPWAGYLGSKKNGIIGDVTIARLRLKADALPMKWPFPIAAFCEGYVHELNQLGFRRLELQIQRVEIGEQFGLDLEHSNIGVWRSEGEGIYLAGELGSPLLNAEFQTRVPEAGERLEVDFQGSLSAWEPSLGGLPVTIGALDSGRGVLELSGYLRWDAVDPAKWMGAMLGDMGPLKWDFGSSHTGFKASSYGIASDREGRVRAYGNAELDSIHHGPWLASDGALAFRLSDGYLAGEFRVDDWLEISFGRLDLQVAGRESVEFDFFLEGKPFEIGWLRSLHVADLPDDFTGALTYEGSGHWGVDESRFVGLDGQLSMVDVSSEVSALFIPRIEAEVQAKVRSDGLQSIRLVASRPVDGDSGVVADSDDFVFDDLSVFFDHLKGDRIKKPPQTGRL